MADEVHWHSRRIAACVLLLFYVNRRRRNRKRCRNRNVWTKPYISRNPSLGAFNTLVQFWTSSMNWKVGVYLGVKTCEVFLCFVTNMFVLSSVLTSLFSLFYLTRVGDRFLHRGWAKSCLTIVFKSVRHFVKCHANHVNRARVLIGWQ